ncbi:MAG: glycosyltransferase, partial [Limnochordales bacterium]
LLKAFKIVVRRRPDAHLMLVGDGPLREQLEETAAGAGLSGRVHFTGTLTKPEVIDVYHAADLFVIASVTETQGLATLEAMAAGLPVAGVNAPGTADMVEHGVQGLLTPEDPEALAEAALTLLNDDGQRRAFAARARARAERFSARNMALELVQAYEEVLAARAPQGAAGRDRAAAME